MPATMEVTGIGQAQGLLAEFTTLHSGAAEQLAVLLLRHALTALLDHRSHVGIPHVPCSVPAHAGDVRLMYVDAGPRGDELQRLTTPAGRYDDKQSYRGGSPGVKPRSAPERDFPRAPDPFAVPSSPDDAPIVPVRPLSDVEVRRLEVVVDGLRMHAERASHAHCG